MNMYKVKRILGTLGRVFAMLFVFAAAFLVVYIVVTGEENEYIVRAKYKEAGHYYVAVENQYTVAELEVTRVEYMAAEKGKDFVGTTKPLKGK